MQKRTLFKGETNFVKTNPRVRNGAVNTDARSPMQKMSKRIHPVAACKLKLSKRTVLPIALLMAHLCLSVPSFAQAPVTVPVDSPAFVFSPGNWTGDAGRGGSGYRQTWNAGAYFRVTWATTSTQPTATLLLDTSPSAGKVDPPPSLTYNVDGVWTEGVPCSGNVTIAGIHGAGSHTLTVYVRNSQQRDRWGSAGASGANVVRVTGLQLDAGSTPGAAERRRAGHWRSGTASPRESRRTTEATTTSPTTPTSWARRCKRRGTSTA